MNNKGFTLVELMAVLVLLGIIVGITMSVFGINLGDAKKKSEEVFVDTIKDSLDMYLTSRQARGLNYSIQCSNQLKKTHGDVNVYKVSTSMTFQNVIDSEFRPITQKDLVNPANKDVACANASDIEITIYRDSDYVYYYSVNKCYFNCLKNVELNVNGNCDTNDSSNNVTNLPKIDSNADRKIDDKDDYFVCG